MAGRRRSTRLLAAAESRDQGPVPNKRKEIHAAATELVAGSNTNAKAKQQRKEEAAPVGQCSSAIRAEPTIDTPALPPRFPPISMSGDPKDKYDWLVERRRLAKLAAKDPRRQLPTVMKPKDKYTADFVSSPRDKALVRDVARSIVNVCSIALDGEVIEQCTGIVVGWNKTKNCARILTSCEAVRELNPRPKLQVRLPNKTILEGQILFFSKHYNIALLEISSSVDLPLQLPTFGPNPNYGQEVFVLVRGEESNLMARHGTVLWFEETDWFGRNHRMFLSCELPVDGTGGPVVDHDGNVSGMAFEASISHPSILATSTIFTCIKMWTKFGCIARPVHGLCLGIVELLWNLETEG